MTSISLVCIKRARSTVNINNSYHHHHHHHHPSWLSHILWLQSKWPHQKLALRCCWRSRRHLSYRKTHCIVKWVLLLPRSLRWLWVQTVIIYWIKSRRASGSKTVVLYHDNIAAPLGTVHGTQFENHWSMTSIGFQIKGVFPWCIYYSFVYFFSLKLFCSGV